MHDSDVVAFEVPRPWPRRTRGYDAKPGRPRWAVDGCYWTVAGRGVYWPPMITVWHREPNGLDAGEVCKHYVGWTDDNGLRQITIVNGWRRHVRHWRLQVHPLQKLRRWALTRCAWCGGRSTRTARVDHVQQWGSGGRAPWWRGERDLYHRECIAIAIAHRTCVCRAPRLEHGDYGRCAVCGHSARYGRTLLEMAQTRVLAAVPDGRRDLVAYRRVRDLYAAAMSAAADTTPR